MGATQGTSSPAKKQRSEDGVAKATEIWGAGYLSQRKVLQRKNPQNLNRGSLRVLL